MKKNFARSGLICSFSLGMALVGCSLKKVDDGSEVESVGRATYKAKLDAQLVALDYSQLGPSDNSACKDPVNEGTGSLILGESDAVTNNWSSGYSQQKTLIVPVSEFGIQISKPKDNALSSMNKSYTPAHYWDLPSHWPATKRSGNVRSENVIINGKRVGTEVLAASKGSPMLAQYSTDNQWGHGARNVNGVTYFYVHSQAVCEGLCGVYARLPDGGQFEAAGKSCFGVHWTNEAFEAYKRKDSSEKWLNRYLDGSIYGDWSVGILSMVSIIMPPSANMDGKQRQSLPDVPKTDTGKPVSVPQRPLYPSQPQTQQGQTQQTPPKSAPTDGSKPVSAPY